MRVIFFIFFSFFLFIILKKNILVQGKCLSDGYTCFLTPNIQIYTTPQSTQTERIISQLLKIIIEERVGVCVTITTGITIEKSLTTLKDDIVPGILPYFNIKHYQSNYNEDVIKNKLILDAGIYGVIERKGWFTFKFVTDKFPLTNTYHGYKNDSLTGKPIFPEIIDYLKNSNNSNNLLGSSQNSKNFEQDLINNLNLSLTVNWASVYTDYEPVILSKIKDSYTSQQPLLFFLYRPHSIFQQYDLQRIFLPQYSEQNYTTEIQNSGKISVDYPEYSPRILYSKSVNKHYYQYGIKNMISTFDISSSEIEKILARIKFDKISEYDASCEWVKENSEKFPNFFTDLRSIYNTRLSVLFSSLGVSIFISIIGIIMVPMIILLYVGVVYITSFLKWKWKTRYSLSGEDLKGVVIGLKSDDIASLWKNSRMAKNIIKEYYKVTQKFVEKYKGYICFKYSDKIVITFSSVEKASDFAFRLKKELLNAKWDDKIEEIQELSTKYVNGKLVNRGPRINIGIFYGSIKIMKWNKSIQPINNAPEAAFELADRAEIDTILVSKQFKNQIQQFIDHGIIKSVEMMKVKLMGMDSTQPAFKISLQPKHHNFIFSNNIKNKNKIYPKGISLKNTSFGNLDELKGVGLDTFNNI